MSVEKIKQLLAYPSLVDYDALFYSDPDAKLLPVGEEDTISKSQHQDQLASLFQDGTKDLNFIASCECGELVGNYFEGTTCRKCGTVVKTNFASDLKFRAWMYIPPMKDDINDPGFIPPILHPVLYNIIDRWLGSFQKVNVLEALLNPEIELPDGLKKAGIGQGYTYFYKNFDDLMNWFLTKFPSAQAKARSKYIPELLQSYRHIAFFRHIPVLNQSLHLLTRSGTMNYADDTSTCILKCKIELSSMLYIYNNGPTGKKFIDQRIWEIYKSFIEYTQSILDVKLLGKKGYIRKLILGARLHCSARAVITPISGEHSCDELHIPWRMGVGLLKLEILNLLINRYNYSMPEALAKQAKACMMYDKDVDDIMQTLIKECRELVNVYVPHFGVNMHPKGLIALFGRNPTLRPGAIMMYFITKIKTDLNDDTISVSSRCAAAPNFDFDGNDIAPHFCKKVV